MLNDSVEPAQIDSLITALEAMLGTLEEERTALGNADAVALGDIAERKATTVEAISRQYEEFKRGLGLNHDGDADAASAQPFTAALDKIRLNQPQLAERLDHLVALTRSCRQSNQDNGALVNLGLHNCQSNMNLLHSFNSPEPVGTYGPQAQSDDRFDSLQRLQLRA
jgi:flagellar biosynthesis/type III secretory pathway chaperone